jgi:hypothetical protein
VSIDNNHIASCALGRCDENVLFAGSELAGKRAAMVMSLVAVGATPRT